MKTTIVTCDICGRKMDSICDAINTQSIFEAIRSFNDSKPYIHLNISGSGIDDVCYKCRKEIQDFIEELKANAKADEDNERMTSLLEDN